MGIFKVFQKTNNDGVLPVYENPIFDMEQEKNIPCRYAHVWNGKVPTVNEDLFEVQNADIMGKPCDCGQFIYDEHICGCSIKKWKIYLEEKQ